MINLIVQSKNAWYAINKSKSRQITLNLCSENIIQLMALTTQIINIV
jgi:hypothetical protein